MQLRTTSGKNKIYLDPELTDRNTVSTLLIPGDLIQHLKTRLLFHNGSTAQYLRTLLDQYRGKLLKSNLGAQRRCRNLYQRPGQKLIRKNFRPAPVIWVEFGIIASFLGVSKCYLFTYLLILDIRKNGQKTMATSDLSKLHFTLKRDRIELRQTLIRNKNKLRREIFQFPGLETNLFFQGFLLKWINRNPP